MSQPSVELALAIPRTDSRPRFFRFVAGVLLLTVLIGFANTFFLRSFFHTRTLASHLYIHGAVLSTWFALLFTQTWLIGREQIDRHRQLGIFSVAVAIAVVLTGLQTNYGLLTTLRAQSDFGPNEPEIIPILGNYFTLLAFTALVTSAVLLRRRAQAHKRLMLLAGIAIIGPALGRIPRFPFLHGTPTSPRNYAIVGILLLIGALIAFDVRTRGRVHPATVWGSAGVFIALVLAVAMGLSGIGFELLGHL